MLGGRSLVNNSIFNLVLMLPPLLLSPTSSSLSFHSPLHVTLVLFTSRLRASSSSSPSRPFHPFLPFILFLSFLSPALIPPCRRPDKDEISTGRARINFYIAVYSGLAAYFSRPRLVIKSGEKFDEKKKRRKGEKRGERGNECISFLMEILSLKRENGDTCVNGKTGRPSRSKRVN